ncbi:hypothetical protein C7405_101630 [Paraburkholderia caballeronis]|uniref:hypothetical protein n=1 Tax=Paraburkholderia caballeronis TaxID=416943 RepID=UPI001065ECC9|nr:hypothetical protein [Paraburkholderia caballeronis]TDV39511.1 hypothetical protein C7405_101630 [Paraburkholderia caballeronis]
MSKDLIASAAAAVSSTTAPIAIPGGAAVSIWTWINGHDISWWVGALTIVLLVLQIRDRIFPRRRRHE